MSAARRLIVNADDLGRTRGVNAGIARAHAEGIVTSATLMVAHAAATEVPALAAAHPRLGIGLHVALTGGPPVLHPERLGTLVDVRGLLPARPEELAGADPAEIAAEARAQLERFRALLGRLPTHLDSHHHSHRLPAVLDVVVDLAREHGLPVRAASPEVAERLRREGLRTTAAFVEDFFGEEATQATLERVLAGLPPGTSELMCHPALVDDELRAGSSYAEPRLQELAVLTGAAARQALGAAGVELAHFGQL